jgi:carbonic anhydrase
LLPTVQTTYRYDGSLTTPPCSEGVKWSVMTQPITFSEAQLAAFTQLFEGNNRPVQELNGRSEVEDTSP